MGTRNVYNFDIERIREGEFPTLKGLTYVDHVGTTLYARSQLEAFHKDLFSNLYGNPHSRSQSSRLTTDTIDQVRYRVLQFFNASAEEYSVVFTSGCTQALKLIAETFTFHDDTTPEDPSQTRDGGGSFVYLLDNHTSVQGMRELVSDRVAGVYCLDEEELDQDIPQHLNQIHLRCQASDQNRPESNQQSVDVSTDKCNVLPSNKLNQSQDQSDDTAVLTTVDVSRSGEKQHVTSKCHKSRTKDQTGLCNLFAYPAQSNFSGRKYPLSWIDRVQRGDMGFQSKLPGKWYVVLDAASYVSTSKLDLKKHKPDFVTLSFYKIFGFPTGLGALLVRADAAPLLNKRYFGGGTVSVSDARERFHVLKPTLADRFEDGTLPFLDLIALRHGLDAVHRIAGDMDRVSSHTFTVAKFFHDHLRQLRDGNDTPVVRIYCQGFEDIHTQGAIVNFNILRDNGEFVGFAEVDKMAQLQDVHLRTGCFCNIGACQKYLHLTSKQIRENFQAGHVCGDDQDMIDGHPTGSVRISFGYMSTYGDAVQCLRFITEYFLEGRAIPEFPVPISVSVSNASPAKSSVPELSQTLNYPERQLQKEEENLRKKEEEVLEKCSESSRFLTKICLYPVKSCAAFQVSAWEVGPRGLLYDREWMIVSESGVTLGQKREPKLCLLQPSIDLLFNTFTLSFPETQSITISLTALDSNSVDYKGRLCTNKVCGDRVNTVDCGDRVADWLSEALGRPGTRLLRLKQEDTRTGRLKDAATQAASDSTRLSLANESQFLLVSRESVKSLQKKMADEDDADQEKIGQCQRHFDTDNLIHRFRGNLIVGGGSGFEEENWTQLKIGNHVLISQGQCSRCQMICMDQETGERSKEPLRTLSMWRGKKVPFGVYMRQLSPSTDSSSITILRVGDQVVPETESKET
ncbi:molybdenum cofactor sulfurase-like isoform X1 [Haliotis rubra]|uniref:molybdenum cofactor sulfurase-like isoform X1 n=1 Tax=Haliotis rubra TaxID=36100 RepID=UPI001EE575EB|nr:molybdenum cofactor sulfurase-like isoform X1 [Haliotis rubra]